MKEQKRKLKSALTIGFILALVLAAMPILAGAPAAADSGPIKPLDSADYPMTAAQQQAQQLALASKPVQDYAKGHRAEVFTILPFRDPYQPAYDACRDGTCYKVDIFDFDQEATVSAIVHTGGNAVIDAWMTPASHPLITPALYARAQEIIQNDPDVVAALGYRPTAAQTRLMDGNNLSTRCVNGRLCAGATFTTDSGSVWVLVDLHEERIEKLWWEDKQVDFEQHSNQNNPKPEIAPQDCGSTIHVVRDGWDLSYLTTPTDGLEVTNVMWNNNGVNQPVATRMKLMEWHARYPSGSGYRDYIGCGGGAGGGFPIYPYGATQVRNLYNSLNQLNGFSVVQDFRMSNWGSTCNYRYEEHFEFFLDGRFRVKTGAYGRGCGNAQLSEATYRPVVRIDVAVAGDANDTFSVWDGSQWATQSTEGWWLQDANSLYTPEGYRYRMMDGSGFGYYIEPGRKQYNDYSTGDNAYTYLTVFRTSEGDGDTGALPNTGCCNTDYQQGPHTWVDGENTVGQNLVMWYVPASATITTWAVNNGYGTRQYCWTDNTSTYWPCFSGPMFVPTTASACSMFDFNCDLAVDTNDVTAGASHWNCMQGDACYSSQYDLDHDLDVDIRDVMVDAAHWNCAIGQSCYRN